jgi:hypothetical protein
VLQKKKEEKKEKEGGRRSEAERDWVTLSCCSEEGERDAGLLGAETGRRDHPWGLQLYQISSTKKGGKVKKKKRQKKI